MSLAHDIACHYGQGKEAKNGDGWITCCPVHGDKNPSLSVWDDGKGGVNVDCKTGCNFKEIKDQFRADGLLPEWEPPPKHQAPKVTPVIKPPEPQEPPAPEKESFPWTAADKDNLSHAKKYLSSRNITIDPLPPCLRWGSYKDKATGDITNMIVAAASKPDDSKVYAVQRLFIDTEDNKKSGAKMLGNCDGRGIWFDRKGDVTEIAAGEGIETMLSVVQATGKNSVAALSTSGMKGLILPEETTTIYICTDSDPVREKEAASMPGQKAAVILAERFESSRAGRTAFIVSPDDSCFSDNPAKLDFNDLLKEDPTGEIIRARFEKAVPIKDLAWRPAVKDKDDTYGNGGDDSYSPETLEILDKLNKRYAAVVLGGDFRIAKEGFDPIAKKNTLSFLKLTSLYSYYANRKVDVPAGTNGGTERREMAKVWMGWDGRRTYDAVVFDPSGVDRPGVYNLFKGFPLTPKEGDWSLMRKHIFEVICDNNAEHFAYVMGWMARAVQDPGGDKPGVAIVMKGGKGIGKGVFVNYFGSIFGEAFLPIADSESFTGRFNMHLSKSLVVFLDEAVWGGDKRAEGKLKQLITEPTVLFEPKGIDSITLGNYINVIIASNEEWVVPATGDERRFCVLQPSESFKQNTEYFGKIIKERKNGGAEAMMYDLLRHDYSDVDLRMAPKTIGLSEQVQQSLTSVDEFWYSVLDREFMLSDRETGRPTKTELYVGTGDRWTWPKEICKHESYAEYLHWCKHQNQRFPKNVQRFWTDTWKIWPGGSPKRYKKTSRDGDRIEAILLPSLNDLRKSFTSAKNIKFLCSTCDEQPENVLLPFSDQF